MRSNNNAKKARHRLPDQTVATPVPTLVQRIQDLRADVDAALDQLAEEKHPPSVPGPWLRQQAEQRNRIARTERQTQVI